MGIILIIEAGGGRGGGVMGECSDIRGLSHSKEGRARSAGGIHKVR